MKRRDPRLLRPILLSLFFLYFSLSSSAQTVIPPNVTSFDARDYDGHPQIMCTHVDRSTGRLFMGAAEEILIYDGDRFQRVLTGSGHSAFSMDQDEEGRVWVGCQSEFGYIESDEKGELRYVSLLDSLREKENFEGDFNIIWNVHCHQGKVFFNGIGRIFVHDRQKGSISSLEPQKRFYFSSTIGKELFVQDIDTGLVAYDMEDLGRRRIPGSEALDEFRIVDVLPVPRGNEDTDSLLVATREGELFFFKDGEKSKVPMEDGLEALIAKSGIYTAAWGPKQNLILGTDRSGLFLLRLKNGRVTGHEQMDRENGAPANAIWDISAPSSASGVLWAGTENGLARLSPFRSLRTLYEGEELKGGINEIERIPPRPEGVLTLATTQGLQVMKPRGGKPGFEQLERGAGICTAIEWLPNAERTAMASEEGFLLSPQSKKIEEQVDAGNSYLALSTLPSRDEEGSDLLCLAGRAGIILEKVDGEGSERLFTYRDHPEQLRFLQLLPMPRANGPDAYAIAASMPSKGVLLLELDENFELRNEIHLQPGEKLKKGECHLMAVEDPSNGGGQGSPTLLLGTEGGLYEWDYEKVLRSDQKEEAKKEFLEPYHANGRDISNEGERVFSVLKDEKGGYWMTLSGELQHYEPDGELDSLPYKALDIGAVRSLYEDADGRIWIGGDYGLASYRPDRRVLPDSSFPCIIQEVRVPRGEGDSLLFGGFTMPREKELRKPVLPYEENDLVLSFVAPFHHHPDRIRYRWKLEGYDEDWTEWKDEAKATYTNLGEGSYRFKVMARNVYGMKSEVAEHSFQVLPPWYRTRWAYASYGVLSVFLFWGVAWLNARRVKAQKKRLERIVQDRTREIQERKEQVEAAHREISDSIEYAQRIQDALLQTEEYVSTHLPEHFILFKPQARVSGDFYWAREKQGYLYIAAVDCTGHGVPGAFMSMLGIAYLNEILSRTGTPTPGTILTGLKDRVVRELTGHDPEKSAKDGMDAALLRIPIEGSSSDPDGEMEVQFAGANNPLYVVRKGIASEDAFASRLISDPGYVERLKTFKNNEDGVEIKGDPRPVAYDERSEEAFHTIELSLSKGDMLYIFSDGYADQFGGPKGKKFRYKPFKELLVKNHEMPLHEQKRRLDRTFEEWKEESEQEQIDDVCVIGLRL